MLYNYCINKRSWFL